LNFISKSNLLFICISLTAFIIPATSVNFTNGFYVAAIMLVLFGWLTLPWLIGKQNFSKWEKAMVFFWVLYCFFTFLDLYFRSGWNWREFQEPSRFILLLPAFLLVRKHGFTQEALAYGVLFGAIASGTWGIYQKYFLGMHRAFGDTTGLIAAFGDISLISGVLCVALLQPKWRLNHWWKLVTFLGLTMGLIGSFTSGTKGGWISIPLLAWVLVELVDKPSYRKRFVSLTIVTLIGACLWVFSPFFQERVSVMGPAIYEYFVNGVIFDGSAGMRLALWHVASLIFFDNPIFGTGPATFNEASQFYIRNNLVPNSVSFVYHPHSQFFNGLYESGIFGPIMVYGIYLTFIMHCKSHLKTNKSLATAGLLLAIGFMDFGLVEVIWDINNAGVYFVSMMMLISGLLSFEAYKEKNN
jgi:O-antigen ligase